MQNFVRQLKLSAVTAYKCCKFVYKSILKKLAPSVKPKCTLHTLKTYLEIIKTFRFNIFSIYFSGWFQIYNTINYKFGSKIFIDSKLY